MNPSLIALTVLGITLMCSVDLSKSECCHVPLKCNEGTKSVERCYDCTEATTYCGKGKCNIFGCNCDDGCRTGDSSLWCWNIASQCHGNLFYMSSNLVNDQALTTIDTNYDGKVTLREATKYLKRYGPKNLDIPTEFKKLDTNGDGVLAYNEIDGY